MGTFEQAMAECGSLMTPNLCDDPSVVDEFVQMLDDAHRLHRFKSTANFMWTGTKRYNETHFRGDSWTSNAKLKDCALKYRRKWTNSVKLKKRFQVVSLVKPRTRLEPDINARKL